MTTRERLLRFFLWWAVLGSVTWVGGTLFNKLVMVPLWSAAPPESVRFFFKSTDYNHTISNFFGPPWMLARNLPVLAALITAWPLRRHRNLLLVAFITAVFGVIYTLAYIYPINAVMMVQAGGTASDEEIKAMVSKWVFTDQLRFGVGIVGFISLLVAFATPAQARCNSKNFT